MPRRTVAQPQFAARLRQLLDRPGMSYRKLAARTYFSKSYLHDLAIGKKDPTLETMRRIDDAAGAGGALLVEHNDDQAEAVELAQRVAASDMSRDTLTRLEAAVDELAIAYATTPPDVLLVRVRHHLGYVSRLVDVRATLTERRRLLVAGGWLSLLAATTHIDLRQSAAAAAARLRTAGGLAGHAEHAEIEAWCLETRAWDVLTAGDYRRTVDLSRRAQAVAPRGSSAEIQATAQEGRAWARMGHRDRTRDALDRVEQLTSTLAVPDQPEHHYRYDPDKAQSYTATTLAWSGDPAAEGYARAVVRDLEAASVARPRRVASARLDLALALLATGDKDEAAVVATTAIASGRVVPSNWWRATEVVAVAERAGVREAVELREAFEANQPLPSA